MDENKVMNFYYQISETDSLTFRETNSNSFELYSKGETTSEVKMGLYENSRWMFEDDKQQELFMWFLKNNSNELYRAFKSYWRSKDLKPTVWECAWRRFKIKVTKQKRKIRDSIQDTFYPMSER